MENLRIEDIKRKLRDNYDVKYRELRCGNTVATLAFIDNLCDSKYISDYIIGPLVRRKGPCPDLAFIKAEVLEATMAQDVLSTDDAVMHILSADVVIVFPQFKRAVACAAKGYAKRPIDIPITETVIKGPREGFTESINDNISAIRRRVKSPKLKIEPMIVGANTQTSVAIVYLEGVTPENIVQYVRSKITEVDGKSKKGFVMYPNYIEEAMKCKATPFDTIGYTEKPDSAVAKLAEGRVLVIVDGNPFVITAPCFFVENFQTTDDYTMNKYVANEGRVLRWISFLMSTLVPGLYLALITYHYKLLPSVYIFRMAIFRAGVPVPAWTELLYMILFFQIVREAGVRLPQPIGPTLSIVGALILGEAAVNSGLASQVTVVIVAITSIASYLVPKVHAAIFVWNILLVLFAGFLGLPGFFTGLIVMIGHIASLTSCGYPYLYPTGTLKDFKYKDVLFRGDLTKISNGIIKGEEQSNG